MADFKRFLKGSMSWTKKYFSLTFLCMLILSTFMWSMIKLGNTYTTDVELTIALGGTEYEIPCVIEGEGLKLLKYTMSDQRMDLALNDVKHRIVRLYDDTAPNPKRAPMVRKIRINQKALKDLVAAHFRDIKLTSVGDFPDIPYKND